MPYRKFKKEVLQKHQKVNKDCQNTLATPWQENRVRKEIDGSFMQH